MSKFFGVDKATKEFARQGDQYHHLLRPLLENGGTLQNITTQATGEFARQGDQYHNLLSPLLKDGGILSRATDVGVVLSYSVAFSKACSGLASLVQIVTGISAQNALNDFYSNVRKNADNISKDLDILVNYKHQHEFGLHIYRFVKYRAQQLEQEEHRTGRNQYMFVYHQGTDWHALFAELVDQDNDVSSNVSVSNTLSESNQMAPTTVTKKSTPRLLGLFDDLNALTAAMQIIRKIVGPEAGFHILMPTTELTMLPELRAFPPDVQPLFLEGELHSGTGRPYYHMNITGASPSMFHNVCNLYREQPNQSGPSLVRNVASTTAAVGAGVGGGVAGATAGFMGASLTVGLLPVAAPVLAVAAIGGTAAGGIVAGNASALRAGKAVEKVFEGKDKDKKSETNTAK